MTSYALPTPPKGLRVIWTHEGVSVTLRRRPPPPRVEHLAVEVTFLAVAFAATLSVPDGIDGASAAWAGMVLALTITAAWHLWAGRHLELRCDAARLTVRVLHGDRLLSERSVRLDRIRRATVEAPTAAGGSPVLSLTRRRPEPTVRIGLRRFDRAQARWVRHLVQEARARNVRFWRHTLGDPGPSEALGALIRRADPGGSGTGL